MAKSTRDTTKIAEKIRRKRPPAPGTPVMTRLQPDQLAKLDAWIKRQDDELSRPEAVRRLVDLGLAAATKRRGTK
jgi:hypothetical protein